jgi:hypothetical protein
MFYRQLNETIQVRLSVPQYAGELFQLTDNNREYLKAWLPWRDAIQEPDKNRGQTNNPPLKNSPQPAARNDLPDIPHTHRG